uniref:Uncharacterized protein n=1 Tax=Avena sativa TaxID=4498 RepID=A0ACD5Z5S7_AVESA
MGSSNPWTPQFGVDAMNAYFPATGGMLCADVPTFHPSMLQPDHGGYGLGLCSGGVTASDVGPQFASNNLLLASLAGQLYASASHAQRPPPHGDLLGAEEMDGVYGRSGEVTLACQGQSDARAMAPCSVSSSDSMASSTDQFSPGPSRSAVTHTSRAEPSSQQAYWPQAPPRFWPVHFAVVVARSPYAPVAQRVLNDAVGHVLRGVADDSDASGASLSLQPSSWSAVSYRDQSMASLEEHSHSHGHGGARWGEARRVRSELINMLQLMDEKYCRCLEEIQSTTAKFSGLMQPSGSIDGGGSICAPFAHRAVSSAYRALRRRITGEIMAADGRPGQHHPHRAESSMVSVVKMEQQSSSWDESAFIQKHLAVRRRPLPQQEWRPQRGLPERSVSVLKAWLFENFLHPYPQDSEKDMLAARTGLTRNQVANWFINARVRLWKPLINELHEELKRGSGGGGGPAPAAMEQMSSQYVVG